MKGEARVHQMVCDYLRMQYPDVIFKTDYGSGLKLTMGQAVRQKRLNSDRAFPDLMICEKSLKYDDGEMGWYAGMFIEIKNEGVKTHKKDGTLVSNPHIHEQARMLERLQAKGYFASFASGFEECKKLIDEYLFHYKKRGNNGTSDNF